MNAQKFLVKSNYEIGDFVQYMVRGTLLCREIEDILVTHSVKNNETKLSYKIKGYVSEFQEDDFL